MKRYERLFEMANVSPDKTGLDVMIWISYKTGKEKHKPRIKVKINNEFIPISIDDDPEILLSKSKVGKLKIDSKLLSSIKYWITMNKNTLLNYWNSDGEEGIDQVLKKLKRIKRFHEGIRS